MWIEFSKLVLCFYFCFPIAFAYHPRLEYNKNSDIYSNNAVSEQSYNYKVSKSRYSKLDKVRSRIENMTANGEYARPNELYHKIRHKGWSNYQPTTTTTTTTTAPPEDYDLFGTYYGDAEEEYDDDDVNYEDYTDTFLNDLEGVQAEEPTERPTAAPLSSFGKFKWDNYGSPSDVAASRRNHIKLSTSPEISDRRSVAEHTSRVNRQGKCHYPSPKVISVQKEHPSPSKIYTPHCTILHRCGEDTGCCNYNTVCQYKKRVLIHLDFSVTILGSFSSKIERLSFYNHTECECRENSNETSTEDVEGNSSGLSFKSSDTYDSSSTEVERCKCTKHFKPVLTYQYNSCKCDCDEDNVDCVQLKKGNEHLRMTDRICISNNECTVPVCEHGVYSRKKGKCPSLTEKMMEFRRVNF